MRKWLLNFIEILIIGIIIVVCIISILQSTFLKDQSLFGYRSYVIASNSMYPVLEYGDVILIKEVDFDELKVDDIITYMGTTGDLKDKVITHEIIEINTEDEVKYLKTKGRANTGVDPYVYKEQVYGKLAYKFVSISFVSKIVRDKVGFILLIFIPFSILLALEFINMVRETKRRELEKLMLEQLDELKKINKKNDKSALIENTICLQLEEVKSAKRDFKKMKELEKTVKIPFIQMISEIDELKQSKKEDDKNNDSVDLDKTMLLFESDDIMKEINKELKIKPKKEKKKAKNNSKKKKQNKE